MSDTMTWITRQRLHGHLLRGAAHGDPAEVVAHLTAVQAQEHGYARWSVAQRTRAPSAGAFDAAFAEGRILRTHVLRPTWHYVAATDLRWLIGLSGPRVDRANAPRYRELGLDFATLDRASAAIEDAVAAAPLTRRELAPVLEERGISVAGQRIAHILMHAELTAVVCSGPMRGAQHTYAAFDSRVPGGGGPAGEDATRELVRRYLSTRGPATVADFSWWSGIGVGESRRALEDVRTELSSREIDGRTWWFVERPARARRRAVDPLQCYDEMIVSYSATRWVLRTPEVSFPVPGHVDGFTHVLLLDGRLLGHWRAVRGSGDVRVETRTNRALTPDEERALADAVERYRRFASAR